MLLHAFRMIVAHFSENIMDLDSPFRLSDTSIMKKQAKEQKLSFGTKLLIQIHASHLADEVGSWKVKLVVRV